MPELHALPGCSQSGPAEHNCQSIVHHLSESVGQINLDTAASTVCPACMLQGPNLGHPFDHFSPFAVIEDAHSSTSTIVVKENIHSRAHCPRPSQPSQHQECHDQSFQCKMICITSVPKGPADGPRHHTAPGCPYRSFFQPAPRAPSTSTQMQGNRSWTPK